MTKKGDGAGRKLFEKLGAAGTSTHVFTGMIKPTEGDDESIMFARVGDCGTWVKVSASQVDDIKLLHTVRCKDHTHPLVHLFMKEPQSSEGKAFAALANLHSSPPPAPAGALMAPHFAAAGQPGATPCYWDWTLNRWVCPP